MAAPGLPRLLLLALSLGAVVACDDGDATPAPDAGSGGAGGGSGDADAAPSGGGGDRADGAMGGGGSPTDAAPSDDATTPPTDAGGEAPSVDVGPVEGDAGLTESDGGFAPDAGPAPIDVPWEPACENLDPRHCALPWPSDRWLVEDEGTDTGYRLAYQPDTFPANRFGTLIDPTPYNRLDGYSPSSQIVTTLTAVPALGEVAGPQDPGRSLAEDFPTVVLDLETGEKVAHWIELDARAEEADEVMLYIRPATRLEPDRSYGVAIRGLVDAEGAPVAPSAAFEALRDGVRTTAETLEARRPGFEALFGALTDAGVPRDDLILAWSFHTESYRSAHETMLRMRDDALERLGEGGLGCDVTEVVEDRHDLARVVRGTVDTPWYADADQSPAALVRDEDGHPVFQGTRPVRFTAVIPNTLLEGEAEGIGILYGHGLFGEADGTVTNRRLVEVASETPAVIAGTDWQGMSRNDLAFLATALSDVSEFYKLGELLQQAMINQLALERSLFGVCRALPEFRRADMGPTVDPARRWFIGGSQGSILGGTLMALFADIDRGALVVGGSGFSFMIERSIHFNTFELLLRPAYPRRLDTALLMAVSQHVWDRAESSSYLRFLREGLPTLDGGRLGAKEVLYLVAENDAQVPNLSSGRAARLLDIPVMRGSSHEPWGVEVVESPYEGSAYVSLDYGDRDPPPGNQSPPEDDGGHGAVGVTPEGRALLTRFLLDGVVDMPCEAPCRVGE